MKNKTNFLDALLWILGGNRASLTLSGITRVYYMNGSDIICIPNNKPNIAYKMKEFKVDAILSNNWILIEDETN